MIESEDKSRKREREFEVPPWDAASITRRRAEDSCAERDAAIEDLLDSTAGRHILAQFGIDIGPLQG